MPVRIPDGGWEIAGAMVVMTEALVRVARTDVAVVAYMHLGRTVVQTGMSVPVDHDTAAADEACIRQVLVEPHASGHVALLVQAVLLVEMDSLSRLALAQVAQVPRTRAILEAIFGLRPRTMGTARIQQIIYASADAGAEVVPVLADGVAGGPCSTGYVGQHGP